MKLIYWDIDGTMINTGKAGMYAIYDVFHRLMGDDRAMPNISAGGRTDNYICQQLLYQARGVMPTDEEVFAFCREYERNLLLWLQKTREESAVLHNVRENLEHFDRDPDVVQLLMTGNSRVGAKMKLEVFGLDGYFDFEHSGFAETFYARDDLARNALMTAQAYWHDKIEDMYVIGDTVYDIRCGKAIGAKTVSVATGHYTGQALAEQEPWRLFPELPDPGVMSAVIHG